MTPTFTQHAVAVYRRADGTEAYRTRGTLDDQLDRAARYAASPLRRGETVELVIEETPEEQRTAWLARWTDEQLTANAAAQPLARGFDHHPRTAAALLTVPAEVRPDVYGEAQIITNVSGGTLSGSVWQAADTWKRGGGFPYTDRNDAMLQRERAAREATGRFTPEPFGVTWPEAAHA